MKNIVLTLVITLFFASASCMASDSAIEKPKDTLHPETLSPEVNSSEIIRGRLESSRSKNNHSSSSHKVYGSFFTAASLIVNPGEAIPFTNQTAAKGVSLNPIRTFV